MNRVTSFFASPFFACTVMSTVVLIGAHAEDVVVGVSWSNFQEERWKTDEAAMKAALEASGAKYISADAQSSAAKQLSDVESLIARGANALIVLTQAELLPQYLGFGHGGIWVISLGVGILIGGAIGMLQGFVIAYMGVPAFIVTLGGLLVWRGSAWWVTSGRTVAPMDDTFRLMGGGIQGAIGASASWVLGAIVCLVIVILALNARRQRRRFHFPLKPIWAEVTTVSIGCLLVFGAVLVANSYYLPRRVAERYAETHGIAIPEGGIEIAHGLPVPVLIAIGVGIVMTFIATRTRFGRYVFAIGGNPEAADLAGINTKRVLMVIFTLMGMLCAIAAAVIGGTSLGGGIGTVAGAMLGALVMQSLQSSMVLMGLDTPLQNIVVGIVLVIAVWIDTVYRRRSV